MPLNRIWIQIFHIWNLSFLVTVFESLYFRNFAVNFVEIFVRHLCQRIDMWNNEKDLSSDKICYSYDSLYFGINFSRTQCISYTKMQIEYFVSLYPLSFIFRWDWVASYIEVEVDNSSERKSVCWCRYWWHENVWDQPARHWTDDKARCWDTRRWVWADVGSLQWRSVSTAGEDTSVVKIPPGQTWCDTTHEVMHACYSSCTSWNSNFHLFIAAFAVVYLLMLWRWITSIYCFALVFLS